MGNVCGKFCHFAHDCRHREEQQDSLRVVFEQRRKQDVECEEGKGGNEA